jgi:dTDP-glucose 4,6-dehydratase
MGNPLATDLDHILSHTRNVWEALTGARVFMTGGTGFFGCWLLESFAWANDRLNLGANMTVLTRSPESFCVKAPHLASHRAINLVQGDVRSFSFPSGRFTHVIHAATEASAKMNREQPLRMLDTIVTGTRRTLDFAVNSGAGRFLLISSGAVYGQQPPELERVPDQYAGGPNPMDARGVYAEGKRVAELLGTVYAQTHEIDVLTARCFAFVGPYLPLDAHFAIGNFINDCLHGRPIEVRGDGTPRRSYLYAADLAIWLWTILTKGKPFRPYNVGSEHAVSIAELAATVRDTLRLKSEVRIAERRHDGVPERYVPDTSRARRELKLEQWLPIEESIRRTACHAAPAFHGSACA